MASSPNGEDKNGENLLSFETWRRKVAWVTGLGLSEDEERRRSEVILLQNAQKDWDTCEKRKRELWHNSPAVVFMVQQMRLINCNVTLDHFVCHPCEKKSSGGFSPEYGILLCQDGFFNKKHMEDTMVHELVHMYDHAKFNVDWNNLRHQACSEIRAANLSGDCSFRRNFTRGWFKITAQHKECVRMRAVSSVAMNPKCPNQEAAEQAVNEVWDSCIMTHGRSMRCHMVVDLVL